MELYGKLLKNDENGKYITVNSLFESNLYKKKYIKLLFFLLENIFFSCPNNDNIFYDGCISNNNALIVYIFQNNLNLSFMFIIYIFVNTKQNIPPFYTVKYIEHFIKKYKLLELNNKLEFNDMIFENFNEEQILIILNFLQNYKKKNCNINTLNFNNSELISYPDKLLDLDYITTINFSKLVKPLVLSDKFKEKYKEEPKGSNIWERIL